MHAVIPAKTAGAPVELLHFVSTFQIKTDTKWLLQIARHLDRASFRLSAACFYGGGPVQDELETMGVRTYNLDAPDERDPRVILRARRLVEKIGCEIVHTHLLRADLFGGAAARWAGVPVIVSTAYAMGQYARARRRRSDRLLDAASARLPTHRIAVSEAVRRDCIHRLHVHPRRVTVVHTGIDPSPAIDADAKGRLRRLWQIGADAPLVVTVARLSHEKGLDTLIDAAVRLSATHPQARVVVVGDGPDRDDLEARVRGCGLDGVVRFAGFHADVWPALAAADVVCLPSKSEGMPNVLLEAMAIGRPIVATAVGGVPEAIVSGQNGLLVDAEDAGGLAGAIARLIDDPSTARRLGRGAARTAANHFTARKAVARYGALYQGLVESRRCRRACLTTAP